jgi:asparagine synthase (glutamine-hydrolysing)
MCGVVGTLSKEPHDALWFSKAVQSLHMRGPDGAGVKRFDLTNGYVSVGHTRLAILDLSEDGSQPMVSDDGRYCITFNGEIYNFKEIKTELISRGYHFHSTSDTEVLLKAYIEYGPQVVARLDGMFAFAILDTIQQNVFLARDPFGKKPLFLYLDEKQFSFASEITALRELANIKEQLTINQNSIFQFFLFGFIPGPASLFKEIKKFPPSCFAIFDIKSWQLGPITEYWDPSENLAIKSYSSEVDLLDEIDSTLTAAVKRRLVADVPICTFLSGGVDSSLVLAKAAQLGHPLESFSTSFPGYGADESLYAQRAADHVGARLNIVQMNNQDMTTAAEEILTYMDEPIADAALLPLYYLSKKVSGKFKVAMGGDGGDELFGGYIKYKIQKTIEDIDYLRHLGGWIKHVGVLPDSYRRLSEGLSASFAQRQFIFGSGGFLPSELKNLFNSDRIDLNTLCQEFERTAESVKHMDASNRSMFLDCRYQLPDWYLVKSDRATMANSLELRSPLLDKNLAELMFQVSGNNKITHGQFKYLLKKLASRYLPKDILYRPKLGFSVDFMSWTRTEHFRDLVFESSDKLPISRRWLEDNYYALSPLKLMRIAFMNHYLNRFD